MAEHRHFFDDFSVMGRVVRCACGATITTAALTADVPEMRSVIKGDLQARLHHAEMDARTLDNLESALEAEATTVARLQSALDEARGLLEDIAEWLNDRQLAPQDFIPRIRALAPPKEPEE